MRDLSHIPEPILETRWPDGRKHRQHLESRMVNYSNTIPLPPSYGTPVRFGDDATRVAHDRKCRQISLGMHRHRWQVAPLHIVTLPSGHKLRAGDVVRPEHFEHDDEPRQPGPIIERLVRLGVLIESAMFTNGDEGPEAA